MAKTVTRPQTATAAIELSRTSGNLIDTDEQEERSMNTQWPMKLAVLAMLVLVATSSTELRAQDSSSMPAVPQQAVQALTGDQQTAANSALCSAIGSHFPNPAAAGPSALTDPGVMSTAASTFAGTTKLPLSGATDMLKGYVSQHASDILASCAASNATSGLPSKIPGAGSLPSVPNMP
jgi:hypothetical protein